MPTVCLRPKPEYKLARSAQSLSAFGRVALYDPFGDAGSGPPTPAPGECFATVAIAGAPSGGTRALQSAQSRALTKED
jgi:hypothetical protein